ncbi:MAG: tRNA-guanine transglycosylase, partial [Candidatus Moranbacteria bacterium]|nr:tRNA-guanine transglycosylase [Candidatus Moranbacteria bacterium]
MIGQRNLTISLKSGVLYTPFFMPDATRATVRGLMSEEIFSSGIEVLVVNTYHLLLQPGLEYIERFGGIHSFMRWKGPLLSDSGGYQVYSLIHKHPDMGKVDEEKV